MKKILFVFLIILLHGTSLTKAQTTQDGEQLTFSLKDACDYALKHNANVKNALIDIESARKKIWETTAIGLPQVTSKLSYSYMITLSSTIEQFNSFSSIGSNFGDIYGMLASLGIKTGDMYTLQKLDSISKASAGQQSEAVSTDDMRWGLTYDITATQIIFSGAYLVGLQTSKVFRQIAELGAEKSQNEVKEMVSNAYYLVLVARANKALLDSTYANTAKILTYIEALNAEGMNEETDVDQMMITMNTLKNTSDMVTRQVEVAKNLLKFHMGVPLEKDIILSDDLNSLLLSPEFAALTTSTFNTDNYVDYKIMQTQEKLAGLNVKYQKSAFLPEVVAFYTHQENFNDKSFSFTPPDMVGVAVNIPLFSSGMRLARVAQAQMSFDKASNTKTYLASGLLTAFSEAKAAFLTAFEKHATLRQNVSLSEKIYKRSVVKYKEGIIGSLELTVAQNQYLQAQSAYFAAIIELTAAKSKLEKYTR